MNVVHVNWRFLLKGMNPLQLAALPLTPKMRRLCKIHDQFIAYWVLVTQECDTKEGHDAAT